MSLRGLGYLRDVADARDWLIEAHPRIASARVLAEVSLVAFSDPPEDQGGSSACVAFAVAAGFDIRARMQGLAIPRIAKRAIYTLARPWPLLDIGCRPRDAMKAVSKHGLVAESRVPFSVDRVNEPMPWDVFRAGHGSRNAKYWRITETGNARVERVRQAVSAGFPVAFATPVDAAVDYYRAGDVIGPVRGPDRGGHMMLIVGYRVTDGAFLVRNSWETDFGDGGYCWVSAERIASAWCTDFWVLEACPTGVS